MKTTLPTFYVFLYLYLSLLIFSTFLPLSLSQSCHPDDQAALLEIKKAFNNPYPLVSWDPETDCCNWDNVECGEHLHRIKCIRLKDMPDLSGPIPRQVGRLPYLETLEFTNDPNLSGQIPDTIANLTKLRFLVITSTKLWGPIPSFIGDLKQLEFIDLSSNHLSGEIPSSLGWLPVLGALRLDRNKLTGPIPDSFGDFQAHDFYLYVSYNQLSGRIPVSMEKKDFTYIDLQENRLEGDVAPLFHSKKKMQFVDLSGNLFKFDLSEVDFPKTLVYLDLSENQVFGSLPEELTQLTSLRHFNVSYNKLCGKIPVGGKMQKFGESAYMHNFCLCGAPLQSCTSLRTFLTFGLCLLECVLSRYGF